MPRYRRNVSVGVVADTDDLTIGLNRAAKDIADFGQRVRQQEGGLRGLAKELTSLSRGYRGIADPTRASVAAARNFERGLDRLNRRIRFTVRRLTSIRGALYSLAGAGGFGLLVKRAADAGAALQHQAELVGVTVEQLQQLRFAAGEVGIGTRQADVAIQRFSRRVGEAAQGAGVLSRVFEETGINIRDSAGNLRDVRSILDDYADAIKAASSDQERLRLAFAAFDTEGAKFASVLRDGAEGLRESAARSREVGQVSDEAARTLTNLSQSFGEVAIAASNAGQSLAAEFAPVFEGVAGALQRGLAIVSNNAGAVARGLSTVGRAFVFLTTTIAVGKLQQFIFEMRQFIKLQGAAALASTRMGRGLAAIARLVTPGGLLVGGIALFATALFRWRSELRQAREEAQRFADVALDAVNRELSQAISLQARIGEGVDSTLDSATTRLTTAARNLARASSAYDDDARAAYQAFEARVRSRAQLTGRSIEETEASLRRLTSETDAAAIKLRDDFVDARNAAQDAAVELGPAIDALGAKYADAAIAVEELSRQVMLASRLGDGLTNLAALPADAIARIAPEVAAALGVSVEALEQALANARRAMDEENGRIEARIIIAKERLAAIGDPLEGFEAVIERTGAELREFTDGMERDVLAGSMAATSAVEDASRAGQTASERWQQYGQAIQGVFRRLAGEIVRGTATMRSAIESLLAALAELALNQAFTRLLTGALGGTSIGSFLGLPAAGGTGAASSQSNQVAQPIRINFAPNVQAFDARGIDEVLRASEDRLRELIVSEAQSDGPLRAALRGAF